MFARSHVCFVNSIRSLGGAEIWFVDAACGLRDRGLQVSIVAQPGSALLTQAAAAEIPCAAIPIRFDAAPWTVARLWAYFRRQRVTAVIANLTKDLKAAGVAGRLAGVPVILASRESDFPIKSKLYYRWYFGRVATGVLVNSLATRATVLDSAPWLEPQRIHLLYKGIDLNRFRPRRHTPGPPRVGFVGQLIERKGLSELMAAWQRLEADGPPAGASLEIAGDGPLQPCLVDWRKRLRHPDRVHLHGFVHPVEEFLGGLACLVLPSRSEGFGLAAAEASACGIPVIGTRASSLPEIVRDGETGLLVPPRDPVALAVAIGDLLGDARLRARFGEAGRRHVSARFDREAMLDRLCGLVTAPERCAGEN